MSIPCKGNGRTFCLTDGTYTGSLAGAYTSIIYGYGGTANTNVNVGTNRTEGRAFGTDKLLGLSTDPTKSGVVADLSDGKIVVIKY